MPMPAWQVFLNALIDPTIDLFHERVGISYLKVCDVEADSVLGVDVDAVAHGLLGPVGVAAVDRCQVANAGHRIVQDLGPKSASEVGPGCRDTVSRPDVGPWRHGQDVGRLPGVKAGSCRPTP